MCGLCGCGLGKAAELPAADREIPKALRAIPIVALSIPHKGRAKQTTDQGINQSNPAYPLDQAPAP